MAALAPADSFFIYLLVQPQFLIYSNGYDPVLGQLAVALEPLDRIGGIRAEFSVADSTEVPRAFQPGLDQLHISAHVAFGYESWIMLQPAQHMPV